MTQTTDASSDPVRVTPVPAAAGHEARRDQSTPTHPLPPPAVPENLARDQRARVTDKKASGQRFLALDALRGLAILLMIVVNWPGNYELPSQFAHADWNGLTMTDVVFPAFLVAMGASLTYSGRVGWRRALGRCAMLYLIGCALVSFKYEQPFDLSVGVLQLTAAAYLLTWLLTRLPRVSQAPLVGLMLVGVAAAYLFVSAPGVDAGQFIQDRTIGEWFDHWLGLPPHPENPHAWLPAVGSVFLGVLAGRIVHENERRPALLRLLLLGGGALVVGLLASPVVPLNKHLWTPTFVLVTGGISLLLLVVLDLLVPRRSKGGPLRPLVVAGGQPIIVYAFSETVVGRFHEKWWPDIEPGVTERWGPIVGGLSFPLAFVVIAIVIAWILEKAKIRIRV